MVVLFKAFRFCGREYLAIRNRADVTIVESSGVNYGAWMSVEFFKSCHRGQDPMPIGTVERLNVQLARA